MLVIETTPELEKLFNPHDHQIDNNIEFLHKEFNAKFDPMSVFIRKGFCYPVKSLMFLLNYFIYHVVSIDDKAVIAISLRKLSNDIKDFPIN
jgi:hypothetical protein